MMGGFGGGHAGSARIRTLAEATKELTSAVNKAVDIYEKHKGNVPLGMGGRAALEGVASALDRCTTELRTTNQRLSELSNRPIVGFLGGGAHEELDRLVVASNGLLLAVNRLLAEVRT